MTEIFDKSNPSKIDSVDLSVNYETAVSVTHMYQCNNLSAIYDVVSMYVSNCYKYSKSLRNWFNIYAYPIPPEDDDRDITD